jgi:hypothetical protein
MQPAPSPPAPPCPKCGSKDAAFLTSAFQWATDDPRHERPPTATVYVYKCHCGMSFTRTVPKNGKGIEP